MLRRIGILALLLSATGAVVLPQAAFAQDRDYAHQENYYRSDRDNDRHEAREWAEHERRDRRVEEWQERRTPEHGYVGHDWRARDQRRDR